MAARLSGIGVASAFVLTLLLLPICLAWFDRGDPSAGVQGDDSAGPPGLGQLLDGLVGGTPEGPSAVLHAGRDVVGDGAA